MLGDRSTFPRDLARPFWKIKSQCEERSGAQLLQAAPGGGGRVGCFSSHQNTFLAYACAQLDQKGTVKE